MDTHGVALTASGEVLRDFDWESAEEIPYDEHADAHDLVYCTPNDEIDSADVAAIDATLRTWNDPDVSRHVWSAAATLIPSRRRAAHRPARRGRGRRVVRRHTSRSSRGSPGRSSDPDDDDLADELRARLEACLAELAVGDPDDVVATILEGALERIDQENDA